MKKTSKKKCKKVLNWSSKIFPETNDFYRDVQSFRHIILYGRNGVYDFHMMLSFLGLVFILIFFCLVEMLLCCHDEKNEVMVEVCVTCLEIVGLRLCLFRDEGVNVVMIMVLEWRLGVVCTVDQLKMKVKENERKAWRRGSPEVWVEEVVVDVCGSIAMVLRDVSKQRDLFSLRRWRW